MNCGCGCRYNEAAFILGDNSVIPERVKKLPEWSYYKFRFLNPNANLTERLEAMKIYLENKNPK